jgi:predicted glycogen debranching enzyme
MLGAAAGLIMIRFDAHICGNVEAAARREWLETNGLGGFASSTIHGMNTRRYHGLLTAALNPPVGRHVLLAKVEEVLIAGGNRYELSVNRYPGTIHPHGHQFLKEFRLDPFPVFTYEAGGVALEKRVFMVHGENTTVVEYEVLSGDRGCRLELRPLLAYRDYHSTAHANASLNPAFEEMDGMVRLAPYDGIPALFLAHNGDAVEASGYWYYRFEYSIEKERGLDYEEDLFQPLVMTFTLIRPAVVIASVKQRDAEDAVLLRQAEIARRKMIKEKAPRDTAIVRKLTLAADQFIVTRGRLKTVVAGYPWFSDWGRDTMIALPGLTLVTGRHGVARDILLGFAGHADQGMLPNRFPDAGEQPEYNTVDGTLWFFEAVRSYVQYSGDYAFVEENLWAVLQDIIAWHLKGTRYGIRMDEDGLLSCGEPGAQLTWMDAKIGDWVVTPRHGKPVEVQALWYNALRVMEDLGRRFGRPDQAAEYSQLADQARISFAAKFWNADAGCLFDVVGQHESDASLRPNQILAVSLPHSMLDPERAGQVVETVRRELLTPLGLRTLSSYDPRYKGCYRGDPWSRDSAYHMGTVWAWLMGPFLSAYVRMHGRSPEARRQAAAWLEEFLPHMTDSAGLGQISEIFDADPPHSAKGCIAQAWSVAELLRAAVEDIYPE